MFFIGRGIHDTSARVGVRVNLKQARPVPLRCAGVLGDLVVVVVVVVVVVMVVVIMVVVMMVIVMVVVMLMAMVVVTLRW